MIGMWRTNAPKIKELIHRVAEQDQVGLGVAKARFAGEAEFSVPSLERLMRGENASDDVRSGTIRSVRARGLKFKDSDLFPEKAEAATG